MKQQDGVTGIHWRDTDAKQWIKDFWGKGKDLCNKIREAWLASQQFANRARESVCKNRETTAKYEEIMNTLEQFKKIVEEDVKQLFLTMSEWYGNKPWLEEFEKIKKI